MVQFTNSSDDERLGLECLCATLLRSLSHPGRGMLKPMDDAPSHALADDIEETEFTDACAIRDGIVQALITIVGRDPEHALPRDWYYAIVYFLRGILGQRMAVTRRRMHERRVYYLSLEYLPGQLL